MFEIMIDYPLASNECLVSGCPNTIFLDGVDICHECEAHAERLWQEALDESDEA